MWSLLESMLTIAVCVIGLLITQKEYRRFAAQLIKAFGAVISLTFLFKWLPTMIVRCMSDTFPELPVSISVVIEVLLCSAVFYIVIFAVCSWRDQVDMRKRLIEKHLDECRELVKDWIPTQDDLMKDEFYRKRKELEKQRSWNDTDWRQPGNVTMETILRDCRERKANELARQIAEREAEEENERVRQFKREQRKRWLNRFTK